MPHGGIKYYKLLYLDDKVFNEGNNNRYETINGKVAELYYVNGFEDLLLLRLYDADDISKLTNYYTIVDKTIGQKNTVDILDNIWCLMKDEGKGYTGHIMLFSGGYADSLHNELIEAKTGCRTKKNWLIHHLGHTFDNRLYVLAGMPIRLHTPFHSAEKEIGIKDSDKVLNILRYEKQDSCTKKIDSLEELCAFLKEIHPPVKYIRAPFVTFRK